MTKTRVGDCFFKSASAAAVSDRVTWQQPLPEEKPRPTSDQPAQPLVPIARQQNCGLDFFTLNVSTPDLETGNQMTTTWVGDCFFCW